MYQRRANTLSNVVVVIGVLFIAAVIVSVALPTLKTNRKDSRALKCSTYMRWLGQALAFYTRDNGGWMPWDAQDGPDPWNKLRPVYRGLEGQLFRDSRKSPLLKSWNDGDGGTAYQRQWYNCPNDTYYHLGTLRREQNKEGKSIASRYVLSYGANRRVMADEMKSEQAAVQPRLKPRKADSTKQLSAIIVFAEVGSEFTTGEDNVEKRDRNDVTSHAGFEIRHTGDRMNVGYLDCHVRPHAFRPQALPHMGLPPFPAAWVPNWDGKPWPGWTQRGITP